ncbi:MAG TPA: CBS domain-containing protein [Methylomirabilota bacterium]|nr:CBS domain-containing protein [Methylomirabilota bacterium]
MRHTKRSIPRAIRSRQPKRRGRQEAEIETEGWPEAAVRVRSVMSRPVLTFRPEMVVGAVARAMRARKIRHAPVVDDKGALVGIVTDRDLRQVILEPAVHGQLEELGRALRAIPLRDVMTWGVLTVQPEADIARRPISCTTTRSAPCR